MLEGNISEETARVGLLQSQVTERTCRVRACVRHVYMRCAWYVCVRMRGSGAQPLDPDAGRGEGAGRTAPPVGRNGEPPHVCVCLM